MTVQSVIKLQSEEHEIINPDVYASREEYVINLMHLSDYHRARATVSNKDVLDLGCNSGYGTNILSNECKSIVGVDVSPMAIQTAKSKYKKSNLDFCVGDGIKLPFNDNSFDAITSFQVIEHLVDYENYFKEIKRVLRPSGILILTTPNAEIRVRPGNKPWNRFHVHEFVGKELDELLSKYFSFTQVIGQFAKKSTFLVEYNRCIKARDAITSVNQSKTLKGVIVNLLPVSFANFLRSILKKSDIAVALSESEMSKYSVDDFYYQDGNLDKSISLVACCSNSKDSLTGFTQTFLH